MSFPNEGRKKAQYPVNGKNYHTKCVMLSLSKHLMCPYDRQQIPRETRDDTRDEKKFRLPCTQAVRLFRLNSEGVMPAIFLKTALKVDLD